MTDTSRENILCDIVGHPAMAPTVAELDYLNLSMDPDAEEEGIVCAAYEQLTDNIVRIGIVPPYS